MYYMYEATFLVFAIIKSKYRSNLKNVQDSELLFDSLFNKKQGDSFRYYLDLIFVIM